MELSEVVSRIEESITTAENLKQENPEYARFHEGRIDGFREVLVWLGNS